MSAHEDDGGNIHEDCGETFDAHIGDRCPTAFTLTSHAYVDSGHVYPDGERADACQHQDHSVYGMRVCGWAKRYHVESRPVLPLGHPYKYSDPSDMGTRCAFMSRVYPDAPFMPCGQPRAAHQPATA